MPFRISSTVLGRIIVVALFVAVIGGSWDIWWHSSLVRETFFEPPHLVLYTGVLVAIATGFFGWRHFGEKVWRNLALALLVIPASGPFDELWHRMFGVEDLSSPLIVWSPPHVVLVVGFLVSFFFLLPVIKQEQTETARRLFGSMIFAAALALFLFLAAPLQPIGAYKVLGFYGSIGGAFALSFMLLWAQRWISGIGAATSMIMFFLVLQSIQTEGKVNPDIIVAPHEHPPVWLMIFSFLAPAAFADVVLRPRAWLRGAAVGFVWAGILYGFSWMVFDPQFQYSFGEAATAIAAGIAGGALGAFASTWFSQKYET